MIRRFWEFVRFPPPYDGPILSGRIDGVAYLLGWAATFAHLLLWVFVLVFDLRSPWKTVSTVGVDHRDAAVAHDRDRDSPTNGNRRQAASRARMAMVARSVGPDRPSRVVAGSTSRSRARGHDELIADISALVAPARS